MRALVLVAVLSSSGCWGSAAPPPPSVANSTAPSTRVVNDLPVHTVWIGHYECAQGKTALQLTLDIEPNGRARAIFDFGPLADNPTVPNGSYRLRGTIQMNDDGVLLSLDPEEWIDRPENYVMVGLVATIDADRRRMRGRILNDTCASLDVTRSD